MATYIQGVTDYVPQFQPFQPDYNFLGNVLQNAQTKYDANYKELSKTYGTLLNSPMLREDNIQQRDEFFKMIDNDIKQISGLDLSLQQNVDSANSVFDSFYKNKEMVKDMVYTKEYQKQLEIGENYRNCINQDDCGGKYWDVGAQALHYKADEFKKANRKDTLVMSPGRFVPQINIQEKAMDYAKEILGKNGTFGITSVNWSPDGRYIVTTKNGQQLQVPLQQLLINQYGKDQAIQDMYQTQSYVNRKGFIAQNLEKYGTEDAAEDAYFSSIDTQIQEVQKAYQEAIDLMTGSQARKTKLEQQIKTNGTTGGDKLSFAYQAAATDAEAATEAVDSNLQSLNIAKSIFEAGDNRQMKRQRVDALLSRSLMNKEIGDSATIIAAMTGQTEVKEDPYVKSYYDHSLRLTELEAEYNLTDRNEFNKNLYALKKEEILNGNAELRFKGAPNSKNNNPIYEDGTPSTTDESVENVYNEDVEFIKEQTDFRDKSATDYIRGLTNTYIGILESPDRTPEEKTIARNGLAALYGKAEKGMDEGFAKKFINKLGFNVDNVTTKMGFDPESDRIITGKGSTNVDDAIADYKSFSRGGVKELYKKAQQIAKQDDAIDFVSEYNDSKEAYVSQQNYELENKLAEVGREVWRENNKNVINSPFFIAAFKDNGGTNLDMAKKILSPNNDIISLDTFTSNFIKEYGDTHKGDKNQLPEIAKHFYDQAYKTYTQVYNSGKSAGGVPLARSIFSINELQFKAGGKSAGGSVRFEYASDEPGGLGTSGLVTFKDDVREGSYFTLGLQMTAEDAQEYKEDYPEKADNAKLGFEAIVEDINSGLYVKDKRDTGTVKYLDVALSDKDKIAIQIFPSDALLKRHKGTEDNPTWADDPDIKTKGIVVYTDKKGAKNAFTQAYTMQPYDIILNHKTQVIDIPNGGKITINKRNADGTFSVTGDMISKVYDPVTKKVIDKPIQITKPYPANTSGQNLYDGLNAWLMEAARANTEYMKGVPQQLYFDVSALPAIHSGLGVKSGNFTGNNMSAEEQFYNSVMPNRQ